MTSLNNKDRVRSGVYGVIVGDMLGVPAEFMRQEDLEKEPVLGVTTGGLHEQPLGAWSDDGALTLALADALGEGFDLKTIAQNFIDWWVDGKYSSHGYAFDIGRQTRAALNQVLKILESKDYEALQYLHYEADEKTNGNGSLMRILPLYFYLKDKGIEENFKIIWQVSALTHPHIRAALACLFYLIMLDELGKEGATPKTAYEASQARMKVFLETNEEAGAEKGHFVRLLNANIADLPVHEIRSGAYVMETIEASLWCLLTTNSYQEAVLKAVNLGYDSDTTAAVTGGLAGFYYGINTIPAEWLTVLSKREDIDAICDNLAQKW